MAKMAFWAIAYCPRGRNQALFRSTIDSFRDNGNRSFDPGGHLGFSKYLKMAFWPVAYCPVGRNRAQFHSTINGFRDNVN